MNDVQKSVVGGCIALFIIVLLLYLFTDLGLAMKETFGIRNRNIDNKIFKESTVYIDGKINDLSNYHLQYLQEKDPVARKAILSVVRDSFSSFDTTDIKNSDLKNWVEGVVGGTINE